MFRLSRLTNVVVGLAASLAATSAQAVVPPVGEQSGWSGFVVFGAGYIDGKSNLISGNNFLDVGTDPVNSVNDSPKSNDDVFPFFTGEVAYTFGSERIQVFAGGSIENWATMDLAQQIGLRKQFETLGTIQVGVLVSGFPAEVWEDPYVEGIKRDDTDQDSPGIRFQWDRIAGTPLEFTFSYRDIDIDTERSGEFLGLSDDERGQLRRDGDQYTARLGYRFQLGPRQWFQPEIGYRENDRDGAAVSNDGLFLRGEWAYRGDIWTFAATAQVGSRDFDAPNPVYDRRLDTDNLSLGLQAFYQLPTASNRWALNAGIVYAEVDSDVDFHDTELFVINFGALYRFGMLPGRSQ